MASKYGLPAGLKLRWKRVERFTGLMSVGQGYRPLELILKSSTNDRCVVTMREQYVDGKDQYIACLMTYGQAPNKRLKTVFDTEEQCKEALEAWVIAHPEQWQQYVDETGAIR